MERANNRRAYQVLVDIGEAKGPRHFSDVNVDIDYGSGLVELSNDEGGLLATAHLGRTLIYWKNPPGGSISTQRLRV